MTKQLHKLKVRSSRKVTVAGFEDSPKSTLKILAKAGFRKTTGEPLYEIQCDDVVDYMSEKEILSGVWQGDVAME